jgi:uncharacterized protein (UPF0332 family)
MVFDWTGYLLLAQELAKRRNDEGSLRSAVSRAYYAAFCTARNRLLQEGEKIPKTGEAHPIVWKKYRNSDQKHRKDIGIRGDRLRRSRNIADYDDEFPDISKKVEEALANASHLLDSLRRLNSGKD